MGRMVVERKRDVRVFRRERYLIGRSRGEQREAVYGLRQGDTDWGRQEATGNGEGG